MPTDLYLIRHGQAHANVDPVVAGMIGDTGLTDLGRAQVRALAARVRSDGPRADVLLTSPLPRARQTAEVLAEATGLTAVVADGLEELRAGEADGLSVEEWASRWPGLLGGPASRPFQPFADGGESWASFLARAGAELTRLVTDHADRSVLAVTHGGVIEASFHLVFGSGPTGVGVRFAPDNSGLTHWRHTAGAAGPAWTLVRFNDAGHLADSAVGGPG